MSTVSHPPVLAYHVLSLILVFSLGIITSVTDISFGKVFNRHLLFFFAAGLLVKLFFNQFSLPELINLLIACPLAWVLYRGKVWAPGDAKLFLVFVWLFPWWFYHSRTGNVFPALIFLVFAFSASFLYLFLESSVLLVRDSFHRRLHIPVMRKGIVNLHASAMTLLRLGSICALVLVSQVSTQVLFPQFFRSNAALTLVILVVASTLMLNRVKTRILVLLGSLSTGISIWWFWSSGQISAWHLTSAGFPILTLLTRKLIERYNYEEVDCESLGPGTILALESVLLFSSSKIRGLPDSTSETTDSRLSLEQVACVKRWAQSAEGQSRIKVVRHLPFAPFLAFGVMLQLVLIGGW